MYIAGHQQASCGQHTGSHGLSSSSDHRAKPRLGGTGPHAATVSMFPLYHIKPHTFICTFFDCFFFFAYNTVETYSTVNRIELINILQWLCMFCGSIQSLQFILSTFLSLYYYYCTFYLEWKFSIECHEKYIYLLVNANVCKRVSTRLLNKKLLKRKKKDSCFTSDSLLYDLLYSDHKALHQVVRHNCALQHLVLRLRWHSP